MNILLIKPFFKRSEKTYPLGLGYIGATLKEDGHNVFGADLSFTSLDDLYSLIDAKGIDMIGVSLMSYDFENCLTLCKKIKEDKSIPIVVGGPHATIFREALFDAFKDNFDYLVVGEGEIAMPQLVNALQSRKSLTDIDNLIFSKNGSVVSNRLSYDNVDLDSYPFVDRELYW